MRDFLLPDPGGARELMVPGPAGAIEALLAAPREPAPGGGCAIICHPHPLYGGALSNKVAYTLAACALQAGLYALRFNFRGVGRSEGVHDHGRGETDDVLFLAQWLRGLRPPAPLLLAGFSFGAYVSLMAATRAAPTLLVSIAPPFGKKYFAGEPPVTAPPCPWLVLHSRDDEVVPYAETVAALQTISPSPELATVDGAGHFFNGRLPLISEHVLPFIQRQRLQR